MRAAANVKVGNEDDSDITKPHLGYLINQLLGIPEIVFASHGFSVQAT